MASEWHSLKNDTPTFQLTSIEKPDLSPFLIHMTGKNSLVKILNGKNTPEGMKVETGEGFLKSCIPAYGLEVLYNSQVVCFTESPIFALDFFRLRSWRRWADNQQYGIGFSKTYLINERDVRPVIYLDTKTNRQMLLLARRVINGKFQIHDQYGVIKDYREFFQKILPLLFPLLETTDLQGFMWEREWRCPNPVGMRFPHEAIKIICCPKNERSEITQILGENVSNIAIVDSWREYDEVTNYLKTRENEVILEALSKIREIRDLQKLNDLKVQNEQTLNALKGYYGVFKETVDSLESKNIKKTIEDIQKKTIEINQQIANLIKENRIKRNRQE